MFGVAVFLFIALCIVSVSFYKNHKRLKIRTTILQNNVLTSADWLQSGKGKYIGEGFEGCESQNDLHAIRTKNGTRLLFFDTHGSMTVDIVGGEIERGTYDFSDIHFKEGDVVIDVGGNIGMISIFLAKKFPFLKIYAFEPVKENFENFKRNMKLNGISEDSIIVYNLAVTKDGRDVEMSVNAGNSGASSISEWQLVPEKKSLVLENVPSCTLKDIFIQNNITSCKLLKMDCEGSEYEILYNTDEEFLRRCENLRAEFHENATLRKKWGTARKLKRYIKQFIPKTKVEPDID